MKKRFCIGCFAALGVAALILQAQTALQSAQEAVQLCIRVIIPSLFPFFVLINLLSGTMLAGQSRYLSAIEDWMNLPSGSGSLFICGLLGGYPTGAQQITSAWHAGVLDKGNAQRMLAFCSNAGPAFIFGIIAAKFTKISAAWLIWGIHILSAFLVGCVYPKAERKTAAVHLPSISFSDSVKKSVFVMGNVCGWVVLFRVLIAFCSSWFLCYFPKEIQILVISIFELANGCTNLELIDNEGLRMIIASAVVNFGGLCVLMQTVSVTAGLKMDSYFKGKVIQTAISIVLTVFVQRFIFPENERLDFSFSVIVLLFFASLVIILIAQKITVAFREKLLYNTNRHKRKG